MSIPMRGLCETSGLPCYEGYYCTPHYEAMIEKVHGPGREGVLERVERYGPFNGCQVIPDPDLELDEEIEL